MRFVLPALLVLIALGCESESQVASREAEESVPAAPASLPQTDGAAAIRGVPGARPSRPDVSDLPVTLTDHDQIRWSTFQREMTEDGSTTKSVAYITRQEADAVVKHYSDQLVDVKVEKKQDVTTLQGNIAEEWPITVIYTEYDGKDRVQEGQEYDREQHWYAVVRVVFIPDEPKKPESPE